MCVLVPRVDGVWGVLNTFPRGFFFLPLRS